MFLLKEDFDKVMAENPVSENYSAQTRIIFSNGSHQHCFIVLVCNKLITNYKNISLCTNVKL